MGPCSDLGRDRRRTRWWARGWVSRAVGSGLLVLLVTACGASSPSPAAKAADQAFLVDVHGQDQNVNELRTDTQLLRLGAAVCSGFSSGVSFFQLADTMQNEDGDLPSTDLGAVITAAAENLCPRYRSRVS